MKIINQSSGASLAQDVATADKPLARIIGLLNRQELLPGQGLIIGPCNSVHTFFMRFPIDVVFVDKNNKIIKAINSLRPFRATGIYFFSTLVIELPAGTLEKTGTCCGDTLKFI